MLSYSAVTRDETKPDGRTLRIATDPDGIEQLKRLVETLDHLSHPSVVTVESATFGSHRAEVTLSDVAGTTLATSNFAIQEYARAIASSAAALAHVHEQGYSLNTINDNTFVIRSDQSAVLVAVDDANNESTEAQKLDVKWLCALATDHLPATDPLRDRINNVNDSSIQEAIKRILTKGQNGELNARELAEQLRHSLWFDTPHPSPQRNTMKHARPSRTRNVPLKKIAFVAAVVAIAGLAVNSIFSDNPRVNDTAEAATNSCALRINAHHDIDGDGCKDSFEIKGGMITLNSDLSTRFTVDETDAQLLLGDWYCDGKQRLAMLRPQSGGIYVFETWPNAKARIDGNKVGQLSGATRIHSERAQTCDVLTVETKSGTQKIDLRKLES